MFNSNHNAATSGSSDTDDNYFESMFKIIEKEVNFLLILCLLIFYIFSSSFIKKKHIGSLHPAAPLILASMLLTFLLKNLGFSEEQSIKTIITQDFIYQFLLPPIVLAEGFNVRSSLLNNHGRDVIKFGIFTPYCSSFFLACLIYSWVHKSNSWFFGLDESIEMKLSFYDCLLLAITLNSVDPHGSVQPFHGGIDNGKMSTIIFGSSLFTNNICLILVISLEQLLHGGEGSNHIFINFIKDGLLSMAFGLIMGMIITYIMKKSPFLTFNPIHEVTIVLFSTYATYNLAHFTSIDLSGDVAIFFFGFFMSNYNIYNMSTDAINQLGVIINISAEAAEACCFIYIGVSYSSAIGKDLTNVIISLFLFVATGACRILSISQFSLYRYYQMIYNKENTLTNISIQDIYCICSAGMIKGPTAYIFSVVLVQASAHAQDEIITYDETKGQSNDKPQQLVHLTMLFSLLVYPTINYLVCLGLVENDRHDIELSNKMKIEKAQKLALDNNWEVDTRTPYSLMYLDEFTLKPLVVRGYKKNKKRLHEKMLKFNMTSQIYDHSSHGDHNQDQSKSFSLLTTLDSSGLYKSFFSGSSNHLNTSQSSGSNYLESQFINLSSLVETLPMEIKKSD